ncbi:hypothetical protein [Streptomyces sp. B1I3]|nr:hypothetical protein [Streptomyces sp. B1I3]
MAATLPAQRGHRTPVPDIIFDDRAPYPLPEMSAFFEAPAQSV